MKIRTVKPEFFTSPGIESLAPQWRLLFIGMWCMADDYGVGRAEPLLIQAEIFGRDERVNAGHVRAGLAEVQRVFGVKFYRAEGRDWYFIPSWEEHQYIARRAKKRNPTPEQGEPLDIATGKLVREKAIEDRHVNDMSMHVSDMSLHDGYMQSVLQDENQPEYGYEHNGYETSDTVMTCHSENITTWEPEATETMPDQGKGKETCDLHVTDMSMQCRDMSIAQPEREREREREMEKEYPQTPEAEIVEAELVQPDRDAGGMNNHPTPQESEARRAARYDRLNATARKPEAMKLMERHLDGAPYPATDRAKVEHRVQECLDAGFTDEQILSGLAAWEASTSWSPSQIPGFVAKAARQKPRGQERVLDWLSVGEHLGREAGQ